MLSNMPLKSLDQLMLGGRRREIRQADGAANHRPHLA